MPGSGKHNVNNIDSFFKVRPSKTNLREGEQVSFLENGDLIKQEKRNGIVYETKYTELNKVKVDSSQQVFTTSVTSSNITGVLAGTGLTGGGSTGTVTLNIDSTVATLTGTQTLTNKTIDLDSNTLTGTLTEFNTALQGDSFVSLTGTQTLTNKTLTAPTLTGTTQGASITLSGDLTVNGTTTTVNQTNLDVSDNIIGLNRGVSNNTNDSGLIIERGSTGDNVFIGWDESLDRIRFATTTADASSTGNLTLTNANVQAGRFYGDVTGNVTGSASLNLLISSNLSDLNNASTARTNLGLAIGTDVQAYDAGLTSIAGLTTAANKMIYTTASDTYATTTLSAAGRSLIDDNTVVDMRTTLGVDAAGTDNSTPVTLLGNLDYIELQQQTLTLNAIDLTTDVTGTLPVANGGTGLTSISTLLNSNVTPTSLGLVIGTDVQAQDTLLQDIADLSTDNPSQDGFVLSYNDAATGSLELVAQNSGTVTGVATGTGLSGGTITTSGSINLDFPNLPTLTGSPAEIDATDDDLIMLDNGVEKKIAFTSIPVSAFNNDAGYVTSAISFNGSTANGLLTYGSSTTADVESNLTFDGSTNVLTITGETKSTKGFTSDGNAKAYTWRAVNNTGGTTPNYIKIARITGTQSSRFVIELAGRAQSYSDNLLPAMGYIVGQLNNDNNFDIVYYNHKHGGTNGEVVDEVGQVDVDSTTTDIYLKVLSFAEVTASGHISDGSFTIDSTNAGTSEPASYSVATEYIVWNSANDGPGSGLNADLLDNLSGGSYLRSDADDSFTGSTLAITDGVLTIDQDDANEGGEIRLLPGNNHTSIYTIDNFYGHLRFFSSTTTGEQFRLTNTGNLAQLTGTKHYFNGDGGNTYIDEVASGQLRLVAGGTEVLKGYSSGAIDMYGGSTQTRSINIGANRSGNGYSYIDLVGDATYSDFGARFIRENTGPNTGTAIEHRGTGVLSLNAKDAGSVRFYTSNTERVRVDSSGNVSIGNISASRPLQIGFTTTNGEAIKLDGNVSYGATISYSRGGSYNWNAGVGGASSSVSNIPSSYWGVEDVSQGNLVRLAIAHTTGNVGIGLNNPDSPLHIANNVATSAGFDSFADYQILLYDTGTSSTSYGLGIRGGTMMFNSDDDYEWRYDNSAVMFLDGSAGRLGIGTTSPSDDLHVKDSSGHAIIKIESDNSNFGAYLGLQNTDNEYLLYNFGGHFRIDEQGVGERFRIQDVTGNVGIGNDSPETNLHIGSGTQSVAALAGVGIANGASAYSFFSASDGTKQYIAGIDHTLTYSKAGTLSNHDHAIITNNVERIYINSSGNVGIGTTDLNSNYKMIVKRTTNCNLGVGLQGGELSLEAFNDAITASVPFRLYGSEFNMLGGNVGINTESPGYKLDVNGNGRFVADLRCEGRYLSQNGSQSAPSYSFNSQGNAGMFRIGTGIGLSAGGSTIVQVNADGRVNYNSLTGVDHITIRSNGHTNSSSAGTFYIKFCTIVVDNSPSNYNGLSLSGTLYRGDNASGNTIDWSVWFNSGLDSQQITHGGYMMSKGAVFIDNIFVQRTAGDGEIDNGSCTYELYYDLSQSWTNNIYNIATEVHYPSEGKYNVTWNSDQSEVTTLPGTEVVNVQTATYDGTNQTKVPNGSASYPAYSFLGDMNTGIYRQASDTMSFSMGGTEKFRFESDGDFHAAQDVIAYSTTPSDRKLKDNIKDIEYGLDTIMQLSPKEYDWKKDNRHDIGFIAQEVEEVIPEIVKNKEWFDDKIKTLDYEKLTAVLIKAVQEQQEQINELKEKLNG